ncbi:MAG: hypothetical protein A2021_06330 [Elusimicrobia bacterium GWF2_52_66]|nr:MAG: hypothetical protein A2X33_02890 [Elusimicrobia bacterium GWA2_51_34]OGR86589.1 MAG: hypothetical protein A2021_06330 [Elusimicrobia bacterium GWF2_52_66]HAF95574.1 hypothetical protein [Elusimicrobiota bacterium]HCE97681.1 hypothetical protein [Elusimicrobiota bacterium]
MKILAITGGTGFVGGSLAKAALASGYTPRILTRRAQRQGLLEGAQYRIVDFSDTKTLETALEGAHCAVHLAAALFGRSKEEFERANTLGTANLVSACAKTPALKKFVYISSLAAGGPSKDPARSRTESDGEAPVSFYGKSKLGGEIAVKKLRNIHCVTLRPPIVYGRNDSGVSQIAAWVKKGLMINAGSGEALFSFIHIDDLVNAILKALETETLNGKTYYVCENKTYPWKEFIALLAKAMGVKMPLMLTLPPKAIYGAGWLYEVISKLTGGEPVLNRDKARESAAPNWTASSAAWEKDAAWLGWTSLEEGIKKTFS